MIKKLLRSLSLSTADSSTFSGWKRPWMSQVTPDTFLMDLRFCLPLTKALTT